MALYLIIGLVGAVLAGSIANGKNLSVAVYALLGFLVPLIGVLIALGAAPAVREEVPMAQ